MNAQDAPAGYQASSPATAPHKHKGKVLCARCAAAQNLSMMPPGKIVACAHSKNGVCTACQAALALPGKIVMVGPPTTSGAPGRAMASSGAASRGLPGSAVAPFDGASGDPTPIGVVQANFSPGAPAGMAAPMGDPSSMPGRAVAEAGPGPAPFRHNPTSSTNPHIFGHLFGWSGLGAERSDAKMKRKLETHAMIHYDNEGSTVNELPASTVYGKR